MLAEKVAANVALVNRAAALLPIPAAPLLEAKLRAVRDTVDGRMTIYVEHLGTGETVAIDADTPYETFSVIKVPIMATVLQRVQDGALTLGDRLTLRKDQQRIPSGVLYALDPGLQPTIRDLLTLMTIISDNVATDALGDLVGREAVTAHMARLGLPETRIRFSDLDWDRLWLSALDPAYKDASGDTTVGFPFDKVPARPRERGVPARDRGHEPVLRPEHRARDGPALRPDGSGRAGVEGRERAHDRHPQEAAGEQPHPARPRRRRRGAHKTGDGQPWVANDAAVLWIKGQPVVLVIFAGHHRGTTAELHDAEARIGAIVAAHFGAAVASGAVPSPR